MEKAAQISQVVRQASFQQQADRAEPHRQRLEQLEQAAAAAGVSDRQFQQMCFEALAEFLAPYPDGRQPQPTREGAAAIDRLVNSILHPKRKNRRTALALAMLEHLDKSGRINDRVFLLRQLEVVGEGESVDRLSALLGAQDAILRHYALRALECNPAPGAAAAILAALEKTTDAGWQVALINSLGARREKTAVPALAKYLHAKQIEVASAAAMALGNIGTAEAAGALGAAAGKASAELKPALAEARLLAGERLRTAGQTEAAEKIFAAVAAEVQQRHLKIAALRGRVLCRPQQSLSLLIDALRSDDPEIQATAARLTLEVPGAEVGQKLLAVLPQLPASAQALLLEALAERKGR